MADKLKKIERSRDGIPIWDGDASTFQEFEENAQIWEQATPYHKRYLCGPRLVSEVTGAAKRFVVGKAPSWVSYDNGITQLLSHLRSRLGLPQMPEITEYLSRFFKQSRRKRGENMNEYITKKSEIYVRACQELWRVLQHHPISGTRSSTRDGWSTTSQPWSRYQPSQTQEDEFYEAQDQPVPPSN